MFFGSVSLFDFDNILIWDCVLRYCMVMDVVWTTAKVPHLVQEKFVKQKEKAIGLLLAQAEPCAGHLLCMLAPWTVGHWEIHIYILVRCWWCLLVSQQAKDLRPEGVLLLELSFHSVCQGFCVISACVYLSNPLVFLHCCWLHTQGLIFWKRIKLLHIGTKAQTMHNEYWDQFSISMCSVRLSIKQSMYVHKHVYKFCAR